MIYASIAMYMMFIHWWEEAHVGDHCSSSLWGLPVSGVLLFMSGALLAIAHTYVHVHTNPHTYIYIYIHIYIYIYIYIYIFYIYIYIYICPLYDTWCTYITSAEARKLQHLLATAA